MIRILADSTCDLGKALEEQYQIGILPLHTSLGEDEYIDGINITPEDIFRWSDAHGATPKTSAPSIEAAKELFAQYLKSAEDEIIIFTISESMSTTANVCRLAAQELEAEERVHVVDSANLSTGIGLQVIEAAIMAQQGKDVATILSYLEDLKGRVRASFVVDTLVYLYRGGRCSGLAALLGSALKLHPKIAVADGKMSAGRKYRGTIDRAIMDYVRAMEEDLLKAKPDRVFITHSGCEKETVDAVRTYLQSLHHFTEILETRAGSVISSHCGPGTLGVLFIEA